MFLKIFFLLKLFIIFADDNCDRNAESIGNVTFYGTNGIKVNMNFMGKYLTLLNHISKFIDQTYCQFKT